MFSLIIPVYKNEACLPDLLSELVRLGQLFGGDLEAVFVVDGSPDNSYSKLQAALPELPVESRLISLSRNFGAFAAITAGLQYGKGDYFGVLAADLQEPPELMLEFQQVLASDEADVVFGYRTERSDPWLSQWPSNIFWSLYRRFVIPEMPEGGVDVFGCTRQVRDRLLELRESNTSLVALLFWLGFRRRFVPYQRRTRQHGQSAWSFGKKLTYAINSIFNFTDLPIRVLLVAGVLGTTFAVLASIVVLTARLLHKIEVSGYTPIMLLIAFFGGLTALGLGIVGQYLWLTLQNTRHRPNYLVSSEKHYPAKK